MRNDLLTCSYEDLTDEFEKKLFVAMSKSDRKRKNGSSYKKAILLRAIHPYIDPATETSDNLLKGFLESLIGYRLGGDNGWGNVQNNRGLGDYWVNEKVTINGVPKAAVRILGRSPHSQMKRAKGIPQYIRSVYSKFTCVICPTKSDIESDHKDGSKVPISMLTLEDFDPKCGHCNKCKSRQCERCMATGLRYDARNMRRSFGWWVGNERFDPYGLRCMGCILYDVILFNYMESIRRRIDKSDSDYKILIDFVQKRYMRPLKDQTDYVFLPEFISLHKLRGIEEFMKSYVNASHIVKPCDEIVLPEKKEIISQTAELVSLPVIIPSIPNAVLDLFT